MYFIYIVALYTIYRPFHRQFEFFFATLCIILDLFHIEKVDQSQKFLKHFL